MNTSWLTLIDRILVEIFSTIVTTKLIANWFVYVVVRPSLDGCVDFRHSESPLVSHSLDHDVQTFVEVTRWLHLFCICLILYGW